MKSAKILIIILTLFLVLNSVNGIVYVDQAVKEGVISNGQLITSNVPVNNVSVIGFVCNDDECNSVSDALWNGNILNTGDDNTIQLQYPTTLESNYGYGVYFFKEGYIPWEIKATWNGNGNPGVVYDAFLTKKDVCTAPIDNFVVENDVKPNIPLVINVEASLDASAHAAIQNTGLLSYIPQQLEEHYSVETQVNLKIYDSSNNIVEEQTRIVNIPYSGTARVEFTWISTIAGNYTAVASTDIIDSKCQSSPVSSTSKDFHVLPEEPKNMCYTLLNGLYISNQFPVANEIVTISANKISNYANNEYVLSPVPTSITANVFDSTGSLIYYHNIILPSNTNSIDSEPFDISYTTANSGKYIIIIAGIAQSGLCDGLPNLQETVRLDLYVNAANTSDNQPPVISGIPDQTLNENEIPPNNWIDLWQYANDVESSDEELQFKIVGESNPGLIDCRIDNDRYVNCILSSNKYGFSDVIVEVIDGQYADRDSFRITVNHVNEGPVIGNIGDFTLEVNDEIQIDLNEYVIDPDNNNNELNWSYESSRNLEVSIDRNNIATIKSKTRLGKFYVTFTVEDPSGSKDSSTIYIQVSYDQKNSDLEIGTLTLVNEFLRAGDELTIDLGLRNSGYSNFDGLKISVYIYDLGIGQIITSLNLDDRDSIYQSIYIPIPKDALPGVYDIMIAISNDKVRRVEYREFIII